MNAAELTERTGWTIHHHRCVESTNDLAAHLAAAGAPARTAVVADEQTAGRGREGRAFVSPRGGIYVSLLIDAPPADLPAALVALAGVAAAEAIESVAAVRVDLKWPNDLLIDRRKAGGILLETSDAARPVVVGIGVNLRSVPAQLAAEDRAHTTAIDGHGPPVDRGDLLAGLLRATDAWLARRVEPSWPAPLEKAWRARLAHLGEEVTFLFAGRPAGGVLEDVSLRSGLLVRDPVSGPVWRAAEHVQDLRPAGRTIP